MAEFLRSFARRDSWGRLLRSRGLVWTSALFLVAVALVKIVLPFFVSVSLVKENMETALSRWTGARATIEGTPGISFWPGPALTLADVRFDTEDGSAPFATARSITADFDLIAALSGKPVFYDFHLRQPVLSIRRAVDGTLNWPVPTWMSKAIRDAAAPDTGSRHGDPIGDIVIDGGTLDIRDDASGRTARIEQISGTIEWRTPTARLNANLSADLNGEAISITAICDAPMAFLSGRESGLQLSLSAQPFRFQFEGRGVGGQYPSANGQLQASVPSLDAVERWTGFAVAPDAATVPLSIEASVSGTASSFKMDNLALALDGASANGLLDLSLKAGVAPKLSGTLAFDKLRAEPFVALAPLVSHAAGHTSGIDLDLRVSAQTASYGPLTLTDVAAGIMANGERTSLDIGDSGYAGGSLDGRISLEDGGQKGGSVQLSLRNADLAALAGNLGLTGPMLQGDGLLSLNLATAKPLDAITARDVSGDIRYSGGGGTLTRFNTETFLSLIAQGRFFDAAEAADGEFPLLSSDIVATLANGVATLTKAEFRGDQQTLVLTGMIRFHSNSLALAGSLTTNDPARPAARFFAGGSWPNAVISPLATLPSE
ncbi:MULTISPECIES: AsmA-like C-terminal region-containing protein [unclassified Rhizobium]|uniref:AsmA family protein n=1 Tax=unclassified Rhizobium TaxID=2613769 RepID=UPI0006FFEE9B|nr:MULTISPECIES: AsmA-like C-terminal region-containing protein [unclassified Rhizobium]KQV43840.1 hypothetical protein ASC86_03315 [Rhizobium sp. Root1212]KRD38023.1 hypothetical protein ASE37_03315 [Rhizobium sp. Root268]